MLQRQRRKHRNSTRPLEEEEAPEVLPLDPGRNTSQPGLWLLLAVPVAAISLCGSKEPWAIGSVWLLMALCVIVRPPARPLSPLLWVPLVLIPILALTAFLPQAWSPVPEWRLTLEQDLNVKLPSTRSPQPWITLDSWIMLTLGISWLLYCLSQAFTDMERRRAVRFLAAFIIVLAAVAISVRWTRTTVPLWRAEWDFPYFGPFPNRNNFGGLLSVGAVLAFAAIFAAIRQRSPLGWLFFGMGIVPLFAAVLMNTSRLGVLLFFFGTGLWMALVTFQKRSAAHAAVTASIMLVLAAGFFLFGDTVLSRFKLNDGSVVRTLAEDGRVQIFGDAIRLIMQSPVAGVGLGNFEPAFAMTRDSFDVNSRAIHPESDWLWLTAECGIPCIMLAIIVLVTLINQFGPWGSRRGAARSDRKMRLATAVGTLMLPLQGLADTPLHAFGMATLAAVLAGLGCAPPTSIRRPHGAWRFAIGAGFAAAGAACVLISTGSLKASGSFQYRQHLLEGRKLLKAGDNAGALAELNAAAKLKPLQWNLYFDCAELKLRLGRSSQEAWGDFAVARQLEPHNGQMCMREVRDWLQYDPPYAIPALREAMRRDKSRAYGFYGDVVNELRFHPELRTGVRSLATTSGLLLMYLNGSWGTDFVQAVDLLLSKDPDLEELLPTDRLKLFRLWYDRGDAKVLLEKLKTNVEWMRTGWIVVADHKVKEGDFRGAFELATSQLPAPEPIPPPKDADLDAMHKAYERDPSDVLRGQQLYAAFKASDQHQRALDTLKLLGGTVDPPPMVNYERGQLLAKKGNYHDAWLEMRAFAEIVGKRGKY